MWTAKPSASSSEVPKTSRTLALNLRKLADWLDSKPEFPVMDVVAGPPYQSYHGNKDAFIAAVRAIGSGTKGKGVLDSYLRFEANTCPEGTEYSLQVNRESVCTLIKPAQPAVYDCEPLLSQAEEAEIGA